MLKNRTIMGRLGISFGLMLALLLACAAVGVIGLNLLYGTTRHVIDTDVQLAQHAAAIDILLLNERRFEKDTFINIADPKASGSYEGKWRDARATLLTQLSATMALELTAADREALAQISAGFDTYVSGYESVVARIHSGEIKTTQDANAAIGEYKPAVHAMEDAAEHLNDAAITRAGRVTQTLAATRNRASALQLGIALACLLSGALMCVVATRSITEPLARAIEVARSVSTGKLDNAIDASGRDETAQLLGSLKSMQEVLLENELNAKGQITAINKAQAVAEFELDGTARVANENFLSMYGYRPEEIRGRDHSIFVGAEERADPAYRDFWAGLRRGEFRHGRYRRVGKNGKEFYVQANYSPILDLAGKPYKVVEYATDVTEQVRMQEALEAAVRETRSVVQGAMDGDLTRRLATHGHSGHIEALMTSVNSLLGSMMSLVATIKDASAEVRNGAEEISKGNLNLSQRTEQSSANLEETASSMEEMTSTVKMTADNASTARQLSLAARERAQSGSAVVSSAIAAMAEINTSSRKIADIIGVIDDIAFQTNLLALNAAVEAARAGEQGRGFAVVASEVRSLAGRSATAAKEIKALIVDSVSKVESGTRLVDDSGKVLSEISLAVQKVSDMISEIAAASREQAAGIEQVNKVVTDLDTMTQQNAALVEEAAAASAAICSQATDLAALVARYSVAASAPPRPAASTGRAAAAAPVALGRLKARTA